MKLNSIALLTLALSLQASADVHLVPAGEFAGRDGRPGKGLTWKLPDVKGRAIAARLNAFHGKVQFNFDYEHQALLSEENGQPAPASGWATQFEWRDGIGLFALNVQWTARAKQMIEGGEYKYISPAIAYDTETGEVYGVVNASLTNIPCLDLNPVAQQRMARLNASFIHQPPENSMNPVLLAMLKALGLTETDATTAEQAVSAIATLKAFNTDLRKAAGVDEAAPAAEAVTAVVALKANADKAASLTTEVATLKAKAPGGNPDPTKFVALEQFNALHGEVALLRAGSVDREVDELIAAARAEGKCSPVVETVWRGIGKADIAQLKALIEKTPGNPALAGQHQTAGKPVQAAADPKAPGSAEELALCKSMGLTLEQFRGGAEVAA